MRLENIAYKAIDSAMVSLNTFCKSLSANDTGATGAHQSGILISTSAKDMLFSQDLSNEQILKKNVRITWQDESSTESCITYYKSKGEFRITRFGRNFPYLKPEQTGSLFVFTQQSEIDYSGFFLDSEEEIDQFLTAFGIGTTEINRLINTAEIQVEAQETLLINNFINSLDVDFPSSKVMAEAARNIQNEVYGNESFMITDPDRKILEWISMEYNIFKSLEKARYTAKLTEGFSSLEDFLESANRVLNRRKSRAGKSFEHHLAALFDANGIYYAAQARTEGNKKPDFLFPSQDAYNDVSYPTRKINMLAAKTTCKDRWRQILNEADRLRDQPKYLCTLQQGNSPQQLQEMQDENVFLVVPKPYISYYPREYRNRILTLAEFIELIKRIQEESD